MSPILSSNYSRKSLLIADADSQSHSVRNNQIEQSILIVEDNLINQRVASSYLTELGFNKMDVASNGYEASNLFNHYYYSLIFLDLDLPDISGLELFQAIKISHQNENTPIVVATAHHEKKIRKKCFVLGADAVISKPLNFDLLKENLPIWLNKNNHQINNIVRNIKSNYLTR